MSPYGIDPINLARHSRGRQRLRYWLSLLVRCLVVFVAIVTLLAIIHGIEVATTPAPFTPTQLPTL